MVKLVCEYHNVKQNSATSSELIAGLGFFHCASPLSPLTAQRSIHIPPEAALPALRGLCRRGSQYTFSAARSSRLFTSIVVTPPLPLKHTSVYHSGSKIPSRPHKRRLGTRRMGSHPSMSPAFLSIQPRTCARLLALPANSNAGSKAEHHHRDNDDPSCSPLYPIDLSPIFILPTNQRHGPHP